MRGRKKGFKEGEGNGIYMKGNEEKGKREGERSIYIERSHMTAF